MTYASASAILHGICATIFLALAILVIIRGKVSRTGLFLSLASLTTALWAGAIAIGGGGIDRGTSALETARIAAWALFVGHLLRGVMAERRAVPRWVWAGPVLARALACLGLDLRIVPELIGACLDLGDYVQNILLGISGFLLLENIFRNAI